MTKATRSVILPRKLEKKLCIVGEQIRAARLRRNLPLALVAERAQCSRVTAMKIEKGDPTVSMGAYLRVLFALQRTTLNSSPGTIRSGGICRTSNCESARRGGEERGRSPYECGP